MTSKEALKKIYNTGANMVIGTPLDNFFKEEVKAIAKDLEVLEILKKHLHIRNGTWSNIITCNIDSLTNENYEILAEWLENDK